MIRNIRLFHHAGKQACVRIPAANSLPRLWIVRSLKLPFSPSLASLMSSSKGPSLQGKVAGESVKIMQREYQSQICSINHGLC